MQTRYIFPSRVSLLEHQRTDYDPEWVNIDARYTKVYNMTHANLACECEDLATQARRMHVHKSLISYP